MKVVRSHWIVLCFLLLGLAATILVPMMAQTTSSGALLTGTVTSASGEKMSGVTVSAKAEGQTITTSVFTDEQGNYYFPAMQPGKYRVWAQADTFETGRANVDLNGAHQQDFALSAMKDFARQLTGDQLLSALPEDTPDDRRMKQVFRNNCTGCHQPNYILQNRFDAQGWTAILNLMKRINLVTAAVDPESFGAWPIIQYHETELAAYLAKMRGPGPSPMEFKIRPRPTGEAARVVISEFDVPTEWPDGPTLNDGSDWSLGTPTSLNGNRGVHDATVDFNGNIWFANSGESYTRTVGKIDTKTGKVTDFAVPGKDGMAAGSHGIIRDPQGMIWFNASGAADVEGAPGRLVRLDPNTGKMDVFEPPKGMSGVGGTLDFDNQGDIWGTTNSGAIRFHPSTKTFTEFKSPTYVDANGLGNTYGMAADSEGNGWWAEMSIDLVGKSNIHTGESTEVSLPPVPGQKELIAPEESKMYSLAGTDWNSAVPWTQGPRRMGGDKNGDTMWVCDWWGGNLAAINIHTLKFTLVPVPRNMEPYEATVDNEHNVWVDMMNADEVAKYDPKTSKWTEFPLPTLGTENRWVSLLERDGKMQVIVPYYRTSKVARITFRSGKDMEALKHQTANTVAQSR